MSSRVYMFIAGDPSGDSHSAAIIRNLRSHEPDCRCIGVGGPEMQSAGFEPLMPFEPFNRMGFFEVITHIAFFLKARKRLIKLMKKEKINCLVCVDYSGFNIPMMKAASSMGIPVVWYIVPMVWAWKKKRAKVLARYATHICCIFPFEPPYFLPFTKNVSFVGNPVAEYITNYNHMPLCKDKISSQPLLAIIPGSRLQEVVKLLKPMIGAYNIIKKRYPSVRAVVSRYTTLPDEIFSDACVGNDIEIDSGPLSSVLKRADIALVASGTATLETALFGVPHVIVYKTSFITYNLFKLFINNIEFVGLPNIISKAAVVPECIQKNAAENVLAERLDRFLSDEMYYRKTAEKLFEIRNMLGTERPSYVVSEIIGKKSLP